MADYSNAKAETESSLSEGLVEEYEIGNGKRRVKRGAASEQVKSLAMLAGLVSRQASGMFRLGKFQEPKD